MAIARRSTVALVLVCLLSSWSSASARASTERPEFGVQFHALWSDYTQEERLRVLDLLSAAGVEWVRIDVGWASLEAQCGGCTHEWWLATTDGVVEAARARGLEVLFTLWRTPAWANDGAGPTVPPHDAADFGRFAGKVAQHFRGRVAAYEIWNEPNYEDFFRGSVSEYVELLRAAYPAIKAADPSAQVVLGGPGRNNTPWLRSMYEAGGGGSFDVLATHPYQSPADLPPETPDVTGTNVGLLSHVTSVRELMVAEGDGDKPIWFTEFGWSAHENAPGTPVYKLGVTREQQADFLVRTLTYLAEYHPYVTNIFWYGERDRDSGDVHRDNYGLLERDLTPKPVYDAMGSALSAHSTADVSCADGRSVTQPFRDVPLDSVHRANIACLADSGIVSGTAPGTFAPDRTVTRAQIATLLVGVIGTHGTELVGGSDAFRDDEGSPHAANIDALAQAGLITGVAPGTFGPDAAVSRAQLATMLVRVADHLRGTSVGSAPDAFDDDDGDVHERNIDRAFADSLVKGTGMRTFGPSEDVTRAQAASFVTNLLAATK